MSLIWALVENCGNQFLDNKGESQWTRSSKRKSTDARNWGGATCSSEEASVMDVERRGCVRLLD